MSQSIKNLNEDSRPREKLLHRGMNSLTNSELIAILIGSGSTNLNAIELGQLILSDFNNDLRNLARANINDFQKFEGIGPAKAITLACAFELGRRKQMEQFTDYQKVSNSLEAFHAFEPHLSDLSVEEFWVIYLNNSSKILAKEKLSSGGITGTVVDNRIIFERALQLKATSLILAHNHPSGNIQPSQEDLRLTEKLFGSGKLMSIRVSDHLIVSRDGYYSFADEGLMLEMEQKLSTLLGQLR